MTIKTLTPEQETSRIWLEDFADRFFSYYGRKRQEDDTDEDWEGHEDEDQLECLIEGLEYGGMWGTDIEYGPDLGPSDELYRHYMVYTGKSMPSRPNYFRCAC